LLEGLDEAANLVGKACFWHDFFLVISGGDWRRERHEMLSPEAGR